ncbi:SDR family oxidoreductase [Legionella pneumophila serogroup 1]|uniref:SDR family oxidoreductase n=1 Tax=Legionella pneumophila TaxID=446 RepID=UPI00077078E2|nr:SDR family oxidoreductase [Legionella pneumophila]HAT8821891.1 SDR family NAD(P)-dependent oxidoreductase [Legionella pneumophila subsp. pneumophila]MCZ4737975.1 SDR family oxidoreductase [Legionella pneumophila]MCZ4747880.1 SDR family oxidoreductase [Legionella pneumophila]MDI9828173.1 SDR family oxidoreductase [Legionella pneumophila]MDO5158257.1 SDR family oxidoreductase [Legionella pneumophila]
MHHLILGYGYCGYYLAQELLGHHQQVTVVSRQLKKELELSKLQHISHDLEYPFHWSEPDSIIYYLIPPPSQGTCDTFLQQFLNQSSLNAKKIIYFGSSGVYGNHQGAWIDELSACIIDSPRQQRRLDAEQQWLAYCQQHNKELSLLRIAGIYGPNRIPVDAAKSKIPIIKPTEAPFTNHIFVKDLALIAYLLGQKQTTSAVYNVADGNPTHMGELQQTVANALGIESASYESFEQAWEKASPMKREFMRASKRLKIDMLKAALGEDIQFTSLYDAVKQSL